MNFTTADINYHGLVMDTVGRFRKCQEYDLEKLRVQS